jgi:hypothetical protein
MSLRIENSKRSGLLHGAKHDVEKPLQKELDCVDEPAATQRYAEGLSRVAAAGRPVIVRRNGEDLAAVTPLEQLEMVREVLVGQEVERSASPIEWSRATKTLRPLQS